MLRGLAAVDILYFCLGPATPGLLAQALPALPPLTVENFGPATREQAQKAYNEVRAGSRDAEANGRLGMAMQTYEQYELAATIEHYRAVIANRPNFRMAHFNLGRMLVHRGETAEAVKHFLNTLTPEDEDTPRFMYALAAAYARIGDREHAIQYARGARQRAIERKQAELLALIERDLRILEQDK